MGQPACDRCRAKHISCNRELPCDHCLKGKVPDTCHYTPRKNAASASSTPRGRKSNISDLGPGTPTPRRSKKSMAAAAAAAAAAAGMALTEHGDIIATLNNNFLAAQVSTAALGHVNAPDLYSLKNLSTGEEIIGSVLHIPITHVPNAHLYSPMILFTPQTMAHDLSAVSSNEESVELENSGDVSAQGSMEEHLNHLVQSSDFDMLKQFNLFPENNGPEQADLSHEDGGSDDHHISESNRLSQNQPLALDLNTH